MGDRDPVDTESMPLTERYTPTFDTGIHQKVEPEVVEPEPPARRRRWSRRRSEPTPADPQAEFLETDDLPVTDVHGVKWWKLILVLLAVWIPAGGVGAGLFYWWSHDNSRHKTTVVFVVLVYAVVTAVVGLMLAMVSGRPLVSVVAIGLLSAVFASVVGAAPVYGKFYCEHSQRHCAAGILPY